MAAVAEISQSVDSLRRDTLALDQDPRQQRDATHQIADNTQQSAGTAAEALNGVVNRPFAAVSENIVMSNRVLEEATRRTAEAESLQREVKSYSEVA